MRRAPSTAYRASDVATVAREVRSRVISAIRSEPADCLMLSGGLDTSILAPFAVQQGTRAAVTVLAAPDAPDRAYAVAIASDLKLTHHLVETSLEGLLEELDFVVRTLATFDPMEIRNSLVIARALREVSGHGYRTAMTGDAADELFGGYSFMMRMPDAEFERYSRTMARTMRFSSEPMGRALGVQVRAPYRDPSVIEYATGLAKPWKVREREGDLVGKWILREAFPEAWSRWRRKDPIEVGSGAARLPEWYSDRTSPADLADQRAKILAQDHVEIRDAEHLAYYRVFRNLWGDRLAERTPSARTACVHCGFALPTRTSTFCLTCGAYPARPSPSFDRGARRKRAKP